MVTLEEAPEGATQGKPDAMAAFATTLQPSLLKLDAELKTGGGLAIAGADDVNALGPPEVDLPAVKRFEREVATRCGLVLRVDKSHLFTWDGDLPPGCPDGLPLAEEQVGDQFFRGFMCYGVPIGEDRYMSYKLHEVAARLLEEARQVQDVLGRNRQALWTSLRASIQQRFDYWCTLCRPSLVRPVAALLNSGLWKVLEAAAGCQVPRVGHLLEEGAECVLTTPVSGLEAKPFAEWVMRQPVKLHGAGLRSHEDSCYPAYIGLLNRLLSTCLVSLYCRVSWVERRPGEKMLTLGSSGASFSLLVQQMGQSCELPGAGSSRRQVRRLYI